MALSNFVTLTYKQGFSTSNASVDICFDVYPPSYFRTNSTTSFLPAVPAVIYFHGGGLSAGNRQSWFPTWLHNRSTSAGYAFISADYQLLPPATGHDIVQDLQDLLTFVSSRELSSPFVAASDRSRETLPYEPLRYRINPEAIAVAGSSAGGLCAYLAAMHCKSPKPKALVSMYGMGGDFFTAHYLGVKTEPFFRGREILDPCDFTEYLHSIHIPSNTQISTLFSSLKTTSDSPLVFHPQTYHIPGYPANPRQLITRLYLQLGIFIDYYTGEYENGGLSVILRDALTTEDGSTFASKDVDPEFLDHMRQLIPAQHRALFPQLGVSAEWPPTMLVHGTDDTAVPVKESRSLRRLLVASGVDVVIHEVEGREHSFDYDPAAEELYGELFDKVGKFLTKHIGSEDHLENKS